MADCPKCSAATSGCAAPAGGPDGAPRLVNVSVIPLPCGDQVLTESDRRVLGEDPLTKACIYSPLPTIPDEQRSASISLETLVAMSRRENHLRVHDPQYQLWMKRMHGARASTSDYENDEYHAEVVRKEPFLSKDLLEHLQLQVLSEFGYFNLPERWVREGCEGRPTSKGPGEFDLTWTRPRSFYAPPQASEEERAELERLYDEFEGECVAIATKSLALYELRTAGMQHPEIPEFQDTIYFKYNRVGFERNCGGRVFPGKEAPNCVLYDPPIFEPVTAAADSPHPPAAAPLDRAELKRTTLHEIMRREFPEDAENNTALLAALKAGGLLGEERCTTARFQHQPRFIITGSYT